MKNKARYILTLGLSGVLIFSTVGQGVVDDVLVVEASQIDELKKKNKEDQKKLDELGEQIDDLTGEQQGIAAEIDVLSGQIAELMASVSILEEEIEAKKLEIEQATLDLEAAKEVERKQYDSMKLRIKAMYESGEVNYIDALLNSASMEDFLNKADYIEKIHEYDQNMFADYQIARQNVEDLKEQLEIEESELEANQCELKEEQEGVELARAELEDISADYVVQISKAKQQAEVYKSQIKQQNAKIKQLEEEERRKAEEAARKAAQKNKNNTTTQKPKGTATVNKDEILAANGSAKGKEIAIYACGFVGNPYVPGGTSLTNGADCSGFTQAVYRAYGYSIPRNSYSQRSAGKSVSYAEAQPGDIICYAGHVALYIGNGKIVHASSVRTGIKISYATYKQILSVRRIV